ncbi:hypothetical protein CCYA_CCYA03G0902 [Cyanidiococcus yangmingshanensis]|nr:hypothetical protein CCYA_CCYA03G0902 [Cyanidiococcus yangmingshanensis]
MEESTKQAVEELMHFELVSDDESSSERMEAAVVKLKGLKGLVNVDLKRDDRGVRLQVAALTSVSYRTVLETIQEELGGMRVLLRAPIARLVHLQIEGMRCNGCVQKVTEALEHVPGVVRAHVHLGLKRARVALDRPVPPSVLIKAALATGKQVILVSQSPELGLAKELSGDGATRRYNCGCGEPSCVGALEPQICGDVGLGIMSDEVDEMGCLVNAVGVLDVSRKACGCRKRATVRSCCSSKASEGSLVEPIKEDRAEQAEVRSHASDLWRASLNIHGMTCATCAGAIEAALQRVGGVHQVSVNLLSQRATVTFDQSLVNATQLQKNIQEIGYGAELVASEPFTEQAAARSDAATGDTDTKQASLILKFADENKAKTAVELLRRMTVVKLVNIEERTSIGCDDARDRRWWKSLWKRWAGFGRKSPSDSLVHIWMNNNRTDSSMSAEQEASTDLNFLNPCAQAVVMLEKADYSDAFEILRAPNMTASTDRSGTAAARLRLESFDWLGRFLFALVFTVPVLVISTILMNLPSPPSSLTARVGNSLLQVGNLVALLLTTPVQLIAGYPFYRGSYYALLKRRRANMDVLVALSTSIAYIYSLVLVVLNGASLRLGNGPAFDTSALLITIILLGKWMETVAKKRAASGMESFYELRPQRAFIMVREQRSPPADANDARARQLPADSSADDGAAFIATTSEQDEQLCSIVGENKWEANVVAEGNSSNLVDQASTSSSEDGPNAAKTTPGYRLVGEIDAKLLDVGDIMRIKPGDRFPADAVVLEGRSSVDESMLTGESRQVPKRPGELVYGGSVNGSHPLVVQATAVGPHSTLSQIIRLVEEAQTQRAPIESVADRIAAVFVPAVLVIALVDFLVWLALAQSGTIPSDWYAGKGGPVPFALLFAISTLVIACPCALGLATPTVIMVATTLGLRFGILFKSGLVLEATRNVRCILFDKTGTLTAGKPAVAHHALLDDPEHPVASLRDHPLSEREVLLSVAAIEAHSEHSLARAIADYVHGLLPEATLPTATALHTEPGLGIQGMVAGIRIQVGSPSWILRVCGETTVDTPDSRLERIRRLEGRLSQMESTGATVVVAAINGWPLVAFAIEDPIRPEAAAVIRTLCKRLEISCWMVTGDHAAAAQRVAEQVGIPPTRVIAGMLPWQKADAVRACVEAAERHELPNAAWGSEHAPLLPWMMEALRAETPTTDSRPAAKAWRHRHRVAFIGDGLNDAPALATADVGIAMAAGTQVAAEAGQIVLMRDQLSDLLVALDLSRAAFRRISLNYVWALGYNLAALPLAAGVLYPAWHQQIPPYIAAIAMAASSVSVTLSSILLELYRPSRWCQVQAARHRTNDHQPLEKSTPSDGGIVYGDGPFHSG